MITEKETKTSARVSAGTSYQKHGDKIEEVMADPCASFWLKDAIKSSLNRDIVDAIHDVEYLLKLLKERINNK